MSTPLKELEEVNGRIAEVRLEIPEVYYGPHTQAPFEDAVPFYKHPNTL